MSRERPSIGDLSRVGEIAPSQRKRPPVSETNDSQCETCRFSDEHPESGGEFLECRKSPPVVIVLDGKAATCWPQVAPANWCAEYKKSPTPRKRRY